MAMHFSRIARQERIPPCRFPGPAIDAPARALAGLASDLRRAVDRDELLLHYQPLVGIESGGIECFEALTRWQHPTRGLIMPDDFIPIAEDIGVIVEIGEWVIERACADAMSWPPPLRVAVNVSPVQIRDSDLGAAVDRALAASGLPASRLELEITECLPLEHAIRCLELFARLRSLGVDFVMDDFGVGYANLACFQRFRFDKIKIDRSFVGRMLDDDFARSIVAAVVALARSLDLKVVAEGVETAAQLAMLRSHGCDQAQGFFIGRPMPIEYFMGDSPRCPVGAPVTEARVGNGWRPPSIGTV